MSSQRDKDDAGLIRVVFQLTALGMLWNASTMSGWLFLVPFATATLVGLIVVLAKLRGKADEKTD